MSLACHFYTLFSNSLCKTLKNRGISMTFCFATSLSKRRMGQASISCLNRVTDILDKDHQKPKGKTKNNRTPSLCKKGLVACRDTAWEFFCEDGTSKSNKQHIRASNR